MWHKFPLVSTNSLLQFTALISITTMEIRQIDLQAVNVFDVSIYKPHRQAVYKPEEHTTYSLSKFIFKDLSSGNTGSVRVDKRAELLSN